MTFRLNGTGWSYDAPHLIDELAPSFTGDDYLEPYSMEPIESKLSVAEKIREVLLAESRDELGEEYDAAEIFRGLESLDDGLDSPLGVQALELMEALEDDDPEDVPDLERKLDALVDLARAES